MKIIVIFDNIGPYHKARLLAGAPMCELLAIEVRERSNEYDWNCEDATGFQKVTILNSEANRNYSRQSIIEGINRELSDFQPKVVFVPGWSSVAAFAAIRWCRKFRIASVAMSESTVWDSNRNRWREWIKEKIVGLCSSALVGGQPHAEYMRQLGMPPEKIFTGYDVVDNQYFILATESVKEHRAEIRTTHGLPDQYFLASARFIEKKNLIRLVHAYARYRQLVKAGNMESASDTLSSQRPVRENSDILSSPYHKGAMPAQDSEPWHLMLLGDGELRPQIEQVIAELGLGDSVHLPGFKQYDELPVYYGLANAFVHASTVEQWGLVVNEAMASGLPVLVSNRCGCATDLVRNGYNGFTFDPDDIEQLANLMMRLGALPEQERQQLGGNSQKLITDWGPDAFATGMARAIEAATQTTVPRASLIDRSLLGVLIRL